MAESDNSGNSQRPDFGDDDYRLPAPNVHDIDEARKKRIGLGPKWGTAGRINWHETNEEGKPYKSWRNLLALLGAYNIQIFFDVFAGTVQVRGMDWLGDGRITDAHENWLAVAAEEHGLNFSDAKFRRCIDAISNNLDRRNEVVEWMEGLEWDGIRRLDTWMTNAVRQHVPGALTPEGNPKPPPHPAAYRNAVGFTIIMSIIARTLEPGCKLDTIPVLVGPQDARKSSLCRILAGRDSWFTDQVRVGMSSKEVIETMSGKLVGELQELAGLGKVDSEHAKAMATTQVDEARLAYGRHTTARPRRFIFLGTSNDYEFLIDATGNRRWLPIYAETVDTDWVRANVEQLFAEAMEVYRRQQKLMRPTWHLLVLPEEVVTQAREAQAAARRLTPAAQWVKGLFEPIEEGRIQAAELWRGISLMGLGQGGAAQRPVGALMAQLGWSREVVQWGSGDKAANYSTYIRRQPGQRPSSLPSFRFDGDNRERTLTLQSWDPDAEPHTDSYE